MARGYVGWSMAMILRRPLAISLAVGISSIACVFYLSHRLAPDDVGDFETRQTARVMVFLWTGAMVGRLRFGRSMWTRAWWTVACLAFVVHVGTAFDRIHHWSHAKAFEHVRETSGFGPGVFVSYLFTILWVADVVYWWLKPDLYVRRSRRKETALHAFFAFIMFNGTVVYESGLIRWIGLAIFAGLGILGAIVWRDHRESAAIEKGLIR